MEYIIYNIKIVITMFTQLNISLLNFKLQNIFFKKCGLFISFGDDLYFHYKKSILIKLFGNSFYNEFNELHYY